MTSGISISALSTVLFTPSVDICIQGFILWDVIFIIRDFKQIAMATSNTAAADAETCLEYVAVTLQISTLNKWYPNSEHGVSRLSAVAVRKTQGGCYYWKTRSVKCFLEEVKNNI